MTLNGLLSLAWQTVMAPREVAQLLLALRLRGEAVVLILAITVILNTLAFSLTALASGVPEALGPVASQPVFFAGALAASVLATIAGLLVAGRMVGGTARFNDLALLLGWMQVLRFLMQMAVAVLTVLSPPFGAAVVLFGMVAGTWILLNFVDVAHGLESLGKSAVVLILGVMAIILVLSLLAQVLGISETDLAAYV